MRETTNYKLGLWEVQDEVGREGINGNFAALDTALKSEAEARASGDAGLQRAVEGRAVLVAGAYMGNGAPSQTIQLGFTPRAVFVMCSTGRFSDNYRCSSGMATAGQSMVNSEGTNMLTLGSDGFTVYYDGTEGSGFLSPRLNNTVAYSYVALR